MPLCYLVPQQLGYQLVLLHDAEALELFRHNFYAVHRTTASTGVCNLDALSFKALLDFGCYAPLCFCFCIHSC